jgi:RNA polymerase sigma-70 factor (ECF subfamily)
MSDDDETALLSSVRSGDRAAAETLFERHVDSLYEFVHWRLGGDRGGVEAIVQETFLTAWRKLAQFESRSSFHTWLCGIAKHLILAARRKKRPAPLSDLLADVDPEIDFVLAGIATEELPDQVIERRETRELVAATLSSLPPDYRVALVKKYVEDEPVAAIALALGKSEKASESTLTRARTAFARVFELLARRRGGLP